MHLRADMIPLKRSAKMAIYAMTALVAACIAHSCLHISMRQDEEHNRILAADLESFRTGAHLLRSCYEHCAERADAEGLARQACLFRALAHSERVHEEACTRAARLFNLHTAEHTAEHAAEYTAELSAAHTAAAHAVKTHAAPYAFSPAEADNLPTDENMRRSIAHEHRRLGKPRGAAVERAIAAGNYYVARIFIWIEGTDRRHIELLENSLRESFLRESFLRENALLENSDRNAAATAAILASTSTSTSTAATATASTLTPAPAKTYDDSVLPCEYCVCPVCGNVYQASNCDAYCPLCRTHCSSFEPF